MFQVLRSAVLKSFGGGTGEDEVVEVKGNKRNKESVFKKSAGGVKLHSIKKQTNKQVKLSNGVAVLGTTSTTTTTIPGAPLSTTTTSTSTSEQDANIITKG
ncbi:unnamed protein product, partial [Amoebophrya sp. A25]|eukprot:GSA25T00025728001.1